jgi:hypothetical protein
MTSSKTQAEDQSSPTLHQEARRLAQAGVPVFPCEPGSKSPIRGGRGFHDATTDLAQIDAWWGAQPDLNLAFCPQNMGLGVVDLDGEEGEQNWAGLELQHGSAPATKTVLTPRGGRHLYFRGELPPTQSRLGEHIDTRGRGSYTLVPPSIVDGKPYTYVDDRAAAPLPAWVAPAIGAGRTRVAAAVGELDAPANIARAVAFLKSASPAIEGQMGDARTFVVACDVLNLGLTPETALDLLEAHWNPRCSPPWENEELAVKVENASRYAQNDAGAWAVDCPAIAFAGPVLERLLAESAANDTYPTPKSAAELAAGNYPRAEYALQNFLLRRHVNLLYGDGGTGKTLLAQHFAVAIAAGGHLFGLATIQTPVLVILAEDDDGETKARLQSISRMQGVNLADLPITTWCLPGYDACIARLRDDGTWEPGPFMEPLRQELARIGPCLLVLDTVSDIAALDETKRLPVNTLCKVVLTGLCREFDATVLVNAHPSKAAMADGSGYAGSTAWNNAVRNRLTLERSQGNRSRRVLRVAKANYGQEAELELKLLGHTFMPMAEAGQSEAEELEAVLAVVLDLVDRGVAVVRANGAGQKPADVAKAIMEKHGLEIDPRRVLAHLNALERQGQLRYEKGGNGKRGQRAGFCRPEAF